MKTESVKPAANDAWTILTDLLSDTAWTLIGIGVVALLGVWVAGETAVGAGRTTHARAGARQAGVGLRHRSRSSSCCSCGGSRRRRPDGHCRCIALAIVVAIGVEALHRLTVRDFPEEAAMPPGEMFHRRRSDEVAGT